MRLIWEYCIFQVRIWTQPNLIDYVDFALEITGRLLEAYEDWTGIKYALPKLGISTDRLVVGGGGSAGQSYVCVKSLIKDESVEIRLKGCFCF